MPAKRRASKRRPTVPPDAWHTALETGFDFFEELCPAGVIEPTRIKPGPERDATEVAWREALRTAWGLYDDEYLRDRDPRLADRVPWALEQFGEPSTCR